MLDCTLAVSVSVDYVCIDIEIGVNYPFKQAKQWANIVFQETFKHKAPTGKILMRDSAVVDAEGAYRDSDQFPLPVILVSSCIICCLFSPTSD